MDRIRERLTRIARKFNANASISEQAPGTDHTLAIAAFEKELDELKRLAEDNYNRFLRTSARLEDVKRRTRNEKAEVLKYGNEGLMRDILPFLDSLEKAIEHGRSPRNRDPETLIHGVRLAIQEMKKLSERYGLGSEWPDDGIRSPIVRRDGLGSPDTVSGPISQGESVSITNPLTDQRLSPRGTFTNGENAVIAVGGAKGGVGKTILAANLAVALASEGKSVIAVDLDLGGSNLHLCMGQKTVGRSLNDFLCNRELDLANVAVPTGVKNLSLIGGDNSLLGTANLQFTQKLKLMRAMRGLQSEIVLLDLGGDTSFNVLDFYLQADLSIVVSSPEPTSYLDAYNFIKVALLRRLSRYNGPEYRNGDRLPYPVQSLLREAVDWQAENSFSTVRNLLDEIERLDPDSRAKLQQVLLDYQPYLILNMSRAPKQSQLIYERIRETGEKMLGISIHPLKPIPDDESVRKSVRSLQPLLLFNPQSSAARAIVAVGRYVLDLLDRRQNAELRP